jgi:hypothetical protein
VITHIGQFDFIELPTSREYTPVGGLVQTRRIKLLKTSVEAYVTTLAANGYAWTEQPDDGSPYSIVTTIFKPQAQMSWALDGNDVDLPIWQSPNVSAMLRLVADLKWRAAYRAEIERFVRGEYTGSSKDTLNGIKAIITNNATTQSNTDPNAPTQPQVDAITSQITDALVQALIDGTESIASSHFVLRKTAVYAPNVNVSLEFANSNKLFSFQALVATEPSIPVNFADKILELKGYWQKKTPSSTQSADGQFTDTVEYWWFRDFNRWLYEVIE